MNSQESKITKSYKQLDVFANFGTHNIGKTVFLDNDRKKNGIIVKSEPEVIYILTQDGIVIEVTNQEHKQPMLISSIDTRYTYILPENIIDNVRNNKVFIVCFFIDPQTKKHTVLHGAVEIFPFQGKDVLRITSEGGAVHIIDPQLIDIDFFVTEDVSDITNFYLSKQNFEIVDVNHMDRKLLCKQLLYDKSFYDNPNFYYYFSVRPQIVKKLLERMYNNTPGYQQILNSIHILEDTLGPSFVSILLDPGILSNLKEFLEYIKLDQTNTNVLQLRKSFSDHLGTQIVYRSMMLSEDEHRFVVDNGIYSRAIYSPDASKILEQLFNEFGTYTPQDFGTEFTSEIERRINKRISNHNSTTISVSGYKIVAESVGYHSYRGDKSNRKLYTFVCNVPRIDVIRMGGIFDIGTRSKAILTIGAFHTTESNDLDVEMFIPFIVNRQWIVGSELVSHTPTMWTRE